MSTSIFAKKIDYRRNCLVISGEKAASCIFIPLINVVAYSQIETNSFGDVTLEFIMLGGYQIKVLTERNLDEGSWSAMKKFLNIWMNKFDPKPDTGDLLNINPEKAQ
jgi:hypothetical protein